MSALWFFAGFVVGAASALLAVTIGKWLQELTIEADTYGIPPPSRQPATAQEVAEELRRLIEKATIKGDA